MCVDDQYNKPCKTYVRKNAIQKCLNVKIKGSEYSSKVIEIEFNKSLVMTEKDHKNFKNSTKKAYKKVKWE